MQSITRRDFLKLGGLSMLSAASIAFEPDPAIYQSQAILYQGSTHFSRVALTYDDCYLVTMLHRLEDILEKHASVRITLFPVGEALLNNEQKDPGVWKRFYKRGHEFGYHSFDHTNPQVVSPANVVADFDRWMDALRGVLDEEPIVRFARPPFGNTSPSFLHMCDRRGVVPTMWSTGWGGPTESVINYTVPKIQKGDVVLLHTRIEDMDTTEKALPELAERGIQPVTMSRLYLDWLKEQHESPGCNTDSASLMHTCIE
jgi:peptidoglycan/xylan/chitin deacetylase (PgdA/CDA1 family)